MSKEAITLESCLRDLRAWIEFALQDVKYRAGTIPPTYTDGYSYVEIPEWQMRQKLANLNDTINDQPKVRTEPNSHPSDGGPKEIAWEEINHRHPEG